MFQESHIVTLAKDIGLAVFRVARLIQHKKIRMEVENAAVDLVKDISSQKINILDRLVHMSEIVGEMNPTNSYVIRRELSNLKNIVDIEIAGLPDMAEGVRIEDIFEKIPEETPITTNKERMPDKFKNRQFEVLQFIRQFPDDCRMRDLLLQFSDVSERTLRNDIQKLINEGLIERAGGKSGPVSYFRAILGSEAEKSEDLSETIFLYGPSPETQ